MNLKIKIENDTKFLVGFFPEVSGCYVQGRSMHEVQNLLKDALELYQKNYKQRREPFDPEPDVPKFNKKITFTKISSKQLTKVLNQLSYNLDNSDDNFLLFRNKQFPFDRILIPNRPQLSPIIIKKLFGDKNVIVRNEDLRNGDEKISNISGRA